MQRFEDGKWRDFGVSATVRVGTFETYVMTGQSGEQRFRMYDPATKRGQQRRPGHDRLTDECWRQAPTALG